MASREPDGSFSEAVPWYSADSPEEAIELYMQRERTKEQCDVPYAEAVNLDNASLARLKGKCPGGHSVPKSRQFAEPETRLVWTCLLAHRGNARAQYLLALVFQREGLRSHENLIDAYKWHMLAGAGGVDTSFAVNKIASELTSAELLVANQKVNNWQPDPTECETISSAIPASPQPD